MYTKSLVSAAAALSLVSGVFGLGCDDETVIINSSADAEQAADCESIDGNVLIETTAGPDIDLSGRLTQIGGNLVCLNNGLLKSLKSSVQTIGGDFQLNNITALSTLSMPDLSEVRSINFVTLTNLPKLSFGTPGVTKANSVLIADTFLDSVDGINVERLSDMNINNNGRLTKFSTSIKSLSNVLYVQSNGVDVEMEMPNLEWIANMTIANVTQFSIPSLATVNGSMRFDSNFFETLIAPNLTSIQDGDLAFVGNSQLMNISLPNLESIGGGMTIANNTQLGALDGFSSLASIGGAVKLRGSFESFDFPALNDVKGTWDASSTADIQPSCDNIEPLGGNKIQGGIDQCQPNNARANDDTSDADSGDAGNRGDAEGAASPVRMSMSTLVSLAAVGAFITAFL